jgi:hypothetical protein
MSLAVLPYCRIASPHRCLFFVIVARCVSLPLLGGGGGTSQRLNMGQLYQIYNDKN